MSYQNLPDPRPLSVRLALGPMPRLVAATVLTVSIVLMVAGIIGAIVSFANDNKNHGVGWSGLALLFALLVGQYVYAIRWNDMHKTWPRRRSYRRHRQMR